MGANPSRLQGHRAMNPFPLDFGTATTAAHTDHILRLEAVLSRTGLSRATLYRKVKGGTFPQPIRISKRCVGWRDTAITEWLSNRIFYQVAHP